MGESTAGLVRISEAASLAVHAMAIMARSRSQLLSNVAMAEKLDASSHHLAKVMRKLVKAGFVESQRGPLGGFRLHVGAHDVRLLQIHEAVEGPISPPGCLLRRTVCHGNICRLGSLLGSMHEQLRDCLADMTLAEFSQGLAMSDARVKDV